MATVGTFRELFYHLERNGMLDLDNSSDLFCLYFVFVPRIQRSLDAFREAWARHRLSTESGRTPLQVCYITRCH